MPAKKRGVRKPVENKKEVTEEQISELASSSTDEKKPVFENTTYNVETQQVKETPVIAFDNSEQEIKTNPVTETSGKKPMKKEVKVLVILVIILLIIDVLSLYLYYKPDLSGFTDFFKFKSAKAIEESNNSKQCKDGTFYDNCSKNKPYYCYNGELLKKAANCGCPKGYNVDFQDCKKIQKCYLLFEFIYEKRIQLCMDYFF